MDAAPAAIPVNPNNAAITAMIRKVNAQRNMIEKFKFLFHFIEIW